VTIEYLTVLHVTDDRLYQEYRAAMTPILQNYSGGFGYDLKVSEVLKSEVETPINRVFTMFIESDEAAEAFFNDEDYLKVRAKYYNDSVSFLAIVSKYEKP
jgi:uncharacterized protein (DUF1330 family)